MIPLAAELKASHCIAGVDSFQLLVGKRSRKHSICTEKQGCYLRPPAVQRFVPQGASWYKCLYSVAADEDHSLAEKIPVL